MTLAPKIWHMITGEYPPLRGGVSDYSFLLARALAESKREVHVWTAGNLCEPVIESSGVIVHRIAGNFSLPGLRRLGRSLNRFPKPRQLLVQYVPHPYGWKAMNLTFAAWVYARGRWRRDSIRTMFHEVSFPWVRRPLRHNLIAAVNRVMAALIARGSHRMYVSTPAWEPILRILAGSSLTPIEWVPVPANIVTEADPAEVVRFRKRLPDGPVVAHFGTYGSHISALLTPALHKILMQRSDIALLLAGKNSEDYRIELLRENPNWQSRVVATGALASVDVAVALQACDVALQPFPDGVSTRRGSMMAVIANGVPVVTNLGFISEPFWIESGLSICPTADPVGLAQMTLNLLDEPQRWASVGAAGRSLYDSRFTLQHTVDAMLCNELSTLRSRSRS